MSLLHVKGLEAGYARIGILCDISFEVQPGEILGVLGHNGMGKSTLLKAVSGTIAATRGAIVFEGHEMQGLPAHRRARCGIGYVPQGRQIFPNLSVRENMMMAALGTGQSALFVDQILSMFPRLQSVLDRAGGVLSGGEQQILAIARCLCGKPKLMLLDEPTEGIQPSIRDEIVESLLSVRSHMGIAMLLVEQNVDFMKSLATRVLVMEKGRLSGNSCGVTPLDHTEL
jgi:branched-chain amino acid transport system ATP-binding protein